MRDKSDKLLSNLQKEYQAARRNLQKQMESWYQKYSGENGVSVAQARKKLTAKESKRHQESIEDFIAKAQTGDRRFDEELRRRYMRSRVSRLQSLQDQVAVQLALLGKSQDVQTFKLLQETCKDTYYHALYNAARRIGINSRFDRFNERVVEQLCKTPWSGKSFSERIWQNNGKLIKEVRHIATEKRGG